MATRLTSLAVLSVLFVAPITASAQDAEEMTTRVYRVADLIRRVPDYPYRSGIPTTETDGSKPTWLKSTDETTTSGGGGGFGGGGAGGGGGFFQIGGGGAPGSFGGMMTGGEQSHELSLNGLIGVISTSIAPDTWQISGGEGTITALGTSLVVRQLPTIHEQIADLLAALREQSDFHKMVTAELFLVSLLPDDELSILKHDSAKVREDASLRKAIMDELRKRATYTGQLTCFSGQEVHLASGYRKSVVTSAFPVVSAATVGYQPVISTLHIGTLVQMTPTLDSQDTSATIDLRCTATEWNAPGEPTNLFSQFGGGQAPGIGIEVEAPQGESSAEIQQVNIGTRELATTVRVPATPPGETPIPVMVGTLGEDPRTETDANQPHGLTYVILAVSQADVGGQP